MENTQKSEKGFLSKLWKTHMTAAKYVGLFGIPVMAAMLPKAAFNAHALNPTAGIGSTFIELWTMMGNTAIEFCVPGWSVIGGQISDLAISALNLVTPSP
jgi:hypothetical protein